MLQGAAATVFRKSRIETDVITGYIYQEIALWIHNPAQEMPGSPLVSSIYTHTGVVMLIITGFHVILLGDCATVAEQNVFLVTFKASSFQLVLANSQMY